VQSCWSGGPGGADETVSERENSVKQQMLGLPPFPAVEGYGAAFRRVDADPSCAIENLTFIIYKIRYFGFWTNKREGKSSKYVAIVDIGCPHG
jgi:hypothetical protein